MVIPQSLSFYSKLITLCVEGKKTKRSPKKWVLKYRSIGPRHSKHLCASVIPWSKSGVKKGVSVRLDGKIVATSLIERDFDSYSEWKDSHVRSSDNFVKATMSTNFNNA